MTPFARAQRLVADAVRSTFAEPVLLHRETGDPQPLRGIFSAAHEAVDVSSGQPVSMVQPLLEVWQDDCTPPPVEGDAVTVRGQRYLIVDVRPDGCGFLRLLLHLDGASP